MFQTLPTRLTFCYTVLFAILSFAGFALIYNNLQTDLLNRVDEELRGDAQEYLQIYLTGGLSELITDLSREIQVEGPEQIFYRVYSPDHKVIATSDLTAWPGLPLPPKIQNSPESKQLETFSFPDGSARVRLIYQKLGNGHFIQTGFLVNDDEELLGTFRKLFSFSFGIMLLSGAVIGYFTAKKALAGIARVRESADLISRGDLSKRIPEDGGSEEIINLTRSFNRMQDRIQNLISELRDVTNNVAHDLRSPVTRMRGLAETTLTGDQHLHEYRETLGAVVEESDRLVGMINTMLEIAETDAGAIQYERKPVDISKIVHDVAELYAPVAEDKNIRLSTECDQTVLNVSGDRGRLQRALANLLDNAVKFTPPDEEVTLRCSQENSRIIVSIMNSGPGIPAADLPHITERFFRGDQSRSTPGNGLGLSLVQSIIRSHGGELAISSEPGEGTKVTLSFPLIA